MKENVKRSLRITGKIFLICIAIFILAIGASSLLGGNSQNLFLYNPFISGFLHVSMDHLFYNMIGVFLFTLPAINSHYTLRNIFWITFFISLAYLPVPVMGIAFPAIGISGTCMFLIARYFLTWERFKILGILLITGLVLAEASSIFEDDGVSHAVHILGAIFGYLSIKSKKISNILSQDSTLVR